MNEQINQSSRPGKKDPFRVVDIARRYEFYGLILLIALTIAAYGQTLGHPFSWIDDPRYVIRNLVVKRGLTLEGLQWAFTTLYFGNWCPLTWLSHMLDVEIFGLNPSGHHLTNLLLHLANTLILFYFLQRATRNFAASYIVALLFAVHPIHVEPVAWISSRKDLLAAFFFFLMLSSYLRYVENASKLKYLLTLALFTAGLSAKTSLVPTPFILLLLDIWPFNRVQMSEALSLKMRFLQLAVEKVPFFLLSFFFTALTILAQRGLGALDALPPIPLDQRLFNTGYYTLSYLGKILYPVNALGYPYATPQISYMVLGIWISTLLLLTLAAVRIGARRPPILIGWGWFVFGILPYLQILQVGLQLMADRWMYLPSVGVFIMLAWMLSELFSESLLPAATGGFMTFAAGLFLTISCSMQVALWSSPETLLRHTLSITPSNPIAHDYLASVLRIEDRNQDALPEAVRSFELLPLSGTFSQVLGALTAQGKSELAIPILQSATPNDDLFWKNHFAKIYLQIAEDLEARNAYERRFAKSPYERSIELAREVLSQDASNATAINTLGVGLLRTQRASEAKDMFLRAFVEKPSSSEYAAGLGAVYFREGDSKNALLLAEKAVKLNLNDKKARTNLSSIYLAVGRHNDALLQAQAAVEIDEQDPLAYVTLGNALFRLNRMKEADSAYTRALKFSPTSLTALNGRGSVLFKLGDYEGAIHVLGKLLSIHPDTPEVLFNYGMALMKQGNRKAADEAFAKAVSLDPNFQTRINTVLEQEKIKGG